MLDKSAVLDVPMSRQDGVVDVDAGGRGEREQITRALDRDRALDAAADAGAFGGTPPLSFWLACVFGRSTSQCSII